MAYFWIRLFGTFGCYILLNYCNDNQGAAIRVGIILYMQNTSQ